MPRQTPLGTGTGTGTGTGPSGPPRPPGPPGPTGPLGTTPGTTTGTTPSFASIASAGTSLSSSPYEWTTVQPRPKPKPRAEKPIKSNRLILVQSVATTELSSLALRNAFNKAFVNKGVAGPVVATVSRTLGQNIVVTTTSQFSADYLLEHQPIWEHLVLFKLAQKDEPWHKVVIHGILVADFNNLKGIDLIIDEIKTFNNSLLPISIPYWLTSAEKRQHQLAGSVVVAFATAAEASQAIRHRLYIAGISARVEKLYTTTATTQCSKCQGFGHLDSYCKQMPTCRLCGDKHATQQHICSTCSAKGTKCAHLVPKCTNCKEAHTADFKSCETLLAIKNKKATTTHF